MAGSGTSKKLAKRNAAAKMLARIHDVPVDLRTPNEADPEDDTFTMVSGEGAVFPYQGRNSRLKTVYWFGVSHFYCHLVCFSFAIIVHCYNSH